MKSTLAFALFVTSVGLACSDDTTFPYGQFGDVAFGDVDDTGGPPDTDATPADAGADAMDPDTRDNDAAPVVQRVGGVTVFETRAPGIDQLVTGGIAAGFAAPRGPVGAPVAEVGPCVVRPTTEGAALLEGGPTADAGEIRVFSAGTEYTLQVTETDDGPRYVGDAGDGQSEFFAAGDSVLVEADGGADVGAFAATVLAPEEPVISEPSWSFGDSHSRDDALSVQWGGGPGTTVVLNLTPVDVLSGSVAEGNGITCTLDDTGGFVVTAELLSWLPEGGMFGGTTVALTVARLVNSAPQTTRGATVTLNVTASHTIVGSID